MPRKKTNREKRLSGNPGGRHVPENDIAPTGPLGLAPAHLDDVGRELWDTLGPSVVEATGAGDLDRVLFAGLCAAWSHHVAAERAIRQHGRVVEIRDANGVVKSTSPSPDFKITMESLAVLRRLAADFGLSPGIRATSGIEPPTPPLPDDIEEIFLGPPPRRVIDCHPSRKRAIDTKRRDQP